MTTRFFVLLVVASVTVGCQGDNGASPASAPIAGNDPAPPTTTARTVLAATGTIEIDGETWTLVPDIPCSVYLFCGGGASIAARRWPASE